jgi:predicted MFS family arabinose efflux permease
VRSGPVGCYVALAALYLVALLLLVGLTRRVPLPASGTFEPILAGISTGLREVRVRPVILGVLLITIVMNTLILPYQQVWSVIARDVLRVGPELLGLLVAADGLGALTGALLIASRRDLRRQRELFVGGSLTAGLLVIAMVLAPWYLLALGFQYLLGIAESCFATMQATLCLLAASERARGRIMGLLVACIGTQPLGALWVGFLASQVGAPIAAASGAAVGLVVMAPLTIHMLNRVRRPGAAKVDRIPLSSV